MLPGRRPPKRTTRTQWRRDARETFGDTKLKRDRRKVTTSGIARDGQPGRRTERTRRTIMNAFTRFAAAALVSLGFGTAAAAEQTGPRITGYGVDTTLAAPTTGTVF